MYRINFKKLNWKHAIVEVVLIFIAINSAIWFNNWNDNNKQRKLQISLLKEIREEIKLDTLDLNKNIRGYENGINHQQIILDYILNKKSYDNTFQEQIIYLSNKFFLTFHNSAYESLKYHGLNIIENDSIRRMLIRLYDFEYKNLETMENIEISNGKLFKISSIDNFNNYFKYEYKENSMKLVPIDYKYLLNNSEFVSNFLEYYGGNRVLLERSKDVQKKMIEVLETIEKEINNK